MDVFERNGYPASFIRRAIVSRNRTGVQQMTQTHDELIKQRIFLPHAKDISKLTTCLLEPYGIQVARKPTSTLRRLVSRPKRPTTSSDQTCVTYKVQCTNCWKLYVGQTGRKLSTRMHEHQLAVKKHESLSLISSHADAQLHSFNFPDVLDRAMMKGGREFLEAWHLTSDSINRHIELDNIYLPTSWKKSQSAQAIGHHVMPYEKIDYSNGL